MRFVRLLAAGALALAVLVGSALPAAAQIEDYAEYRPQTHCKPKAKPGATALQDWLVAHRGGGKGPIGRPCSSGGTSEHKEGRALDWTLDAAKKKQRRIANKFLAFAVAEDAQGHQDAKARRMGIMYVIWNDHMYSAWDKFQKENYLSSSCRNRRTCSKTLRHRDHVHISLSRAGGRGETSWYDGRVPERAE